MKCFSSRRRGNTGGAWNCNLRGENRQGMILHIRDRGSQWSKQDFKMSKRKHFSHLEHFQMWSLLSRCAVEIRPWRAVKCRISGVWIPQWLLALSLGLSFPQRSDLLNGTNQEEMPGESRLCLHSLFSYFSQVIPSCLGLKAECWAGWVMWLIQLLCDVLSSVIY